MINVVTVVIVVAVVVVIIVVDVDDGVASVRHRTSPLFSASHLIIRGLNFTTLMMGLELGGGGGGGGGKIQRKTMFVSYSASVLFDAGH